MKKLNEKTKILLAMGLMAAICLVCSRTMLFNTAYGYNYGYGYEYTYWVDFTQSINGENHHSYPLRIFGATGGGTYHFTINDADPATTAVMGSGPVNDACFTVPALDLSRLSEGPVTLSFFIVDAQGRQGTTLVETNYVAFSHAQVQLSTDGKKRYPSRFTSRREMYLLFKNVPAATHFQVSRNSGFQDAGWYPIKKKKKIFLRAKKHVSQYYYIRFKDANGTLSGAISKKLVYE